jgi:hypothetical protein
MLEYGTKPRWLLETVMRNYIIKVISLILVKHVLNASMVDINTMNFESRGKEKIDYELERALNGLCPNSFR